MTLFNKSVLSHYLNLHDEEMVLMAYNSYKHHFNSKYHNKFIELKFEECHLDICEELFTKVLGYTIKPLPEYDLIIGTNNATNLIKADAVILKRGQIVAIIVFARGCVNLRTAASAAYLNNNNQKDCKYVIILNYEIIRFHIEGAAGFQEFNLLTLSKKDFDVLFLCMHKNNLMSDLPNTILKKSITNEEILINNLYNDYSNFHKLLYADMLALNPRFNKLTLYKKSRIILNRIMFILYAEDMGLLPINTFYSLRKDKSTSEKFDFTHNYYPILLRYFSMLNSRDYHQGEQAIVYNGGLFATDEELSKITISDDFFLNYLPVLMKYDYKNEVDVNILSHVFESFLTDRNKLQADLEDEPINKLHFRKAANEIHYTSKFIAKYVVDYAIGSLCANKRTEYGIVIESYTPENRKEKRSVLLDNLLKYKDWLYNITILDPACGSGRYLCQALEFLLEEYNCIDNLVARLQGKCIQFVRHEFAILENNLFGFDINKETVDITHLNLWLRSAFYGQELIALKNTIKYPKCSINEHYVYEPFDWIAEYTKIYLKGKSYKHITQSGFDVVIGSPVYLYCNAITFIEATHFDIGAKKIKIGSKENSYFQIWEYLLDLTSKLTATNAFVSFVIPGFLLSNRFLKNYLLLYFHIEECNTPHLLDQKLSSLS